MRWKKHSRFEGQHAFLSESKHSWIVYSDDELVKSYYAFLATKKGTKQHELAAMLIEQGEKLPDIRRTLNMYVNDAIDFGMRPEQKLYFSDNCFGTADAISFDEDLGFLRIHDLKTGVTPVTNKTGRIPQLEIYAAYFFLEYDYDLRDIDIELRVYQNDDIIVEKPYIDDIAPIMDKIVYFDKLIEQIKREEQ